jgi:hypothetical protein
MNYELGLTLHVLSLLTRLALKRLVTHGINSCLVHYEHDVANDIIRVV